jgi:hypothetical protein
MHVNEVIRIACGLAIALHQHLATAVQQRQSGAEALGVDLGGQAARVGDVQGVETRVVVQNALRGGLACGEGERNSRSERGAGE